jgi:hypothetical protein
VTTHVGRNDPCPCGSGKKFKNCCEGKLRLGERSVGGIRLWVFAGLAAAAAAILIAVWSVERPSGGARAPRTATPMAPQAAVPAGAPWAYDSVANRYWDPGHQHWHDGPPPPPEQRGQPAPPGGMTMPGAGPTPAAWAYDSVSNRHWDPGHGHWHQGPPPPGSR